MFSGIITNEKRAEIAQEANEKAEKLNEHLATAAWVCDLLKISRPTLFNLMKDNKICGHFRVGDFILFDLRVARPSIEERQQRGRVRAANLANKQYHGITKDLYEANYGPAKKGEFVDEIEFYYIDPMDGAEYTVPEDHKHDLEGYAEIVADWRYSNGECHVERQTKYPKSMYAALLLGCLKLAEKEYAKRAEVF